MRSIETAKKPPAGASPERERWEYTMLPMRPNQADNLAILNGVGAEGWELVQVLGLEYWMKRKAVG
jgi:hypothetical protein